MQNNLYYGTRGPADAPIVVVGESWGAEEAVQKAPFVGSSGTELTRILAEAGVPISDILFTNMVAEKPHANETWRFFEPKSKNPNRIGGLAPSPMAQLEISRLYSQIASHPRRLVIAAGNWPFWALSSKAGIEVLRSSNNRPIPADQQTWVPTGITNHRGSMWYVEPHQEFLNGPHGPPSSPIPLLPIIHPAAIQRAWYQRPVTVHDLKARVPMALRSDWRPKQIEINVLPTFADATGILNMWLAAANTALRRNHTMRLVCDIETVRRRFISVVGFSDSPTRAIAIPFLKADTSDGSFESYWTPDQEAIIIGLIRRILLHPAILIEGQNFIYDTQFFQYEMGVTPTLDFDSMIAQNTLFPGTPKALEYLSSLYCEYHWYWKEDAKDWQTVGNIQVLCEYNCTDTMRTYEICGVQRKLISDMNQQPQYDFKMKVNDLCLRMMNNGVRINKPLRNSLKLKLDEALNGFYTELEQIIPQDMVSPGHKTRWYRSDKQTKTLLYDILGMRVVRNPKTGRPTSGKPALKQLEKWYPEFTGLFHRLDYAGSVENTAQVIATALDSDGNMRCSFNPAGAETHRLSSSENAFGRGTNLQNITKGEEDE
jgi:uracil-DNA glycosylase